MESNDGERDDVDVLPRSLMVSVLGVIARRLPEMRVERRGAVFVPEVGVVRGVVEVFLDAGFARDRGETRVVEVAARW